LGGQAGAGPARAGARARRAGDERALLRDRRHLRSEGGEVRHRDGRRARPVRPGRRVGRARRRVRLGDLPLADPPRHPAALGAPDRLSAPRLRLGSEGRRPQRLGLTLAVVGIVVVSHSQALAEGVVRLAREMGGEGLAIEAAGGIEEEGVLGTDADRVRGAIERAMSAEGVLVLMDLGSALMSAEFAVEMLEGAPGPVKLSAAPLVEGAVAAAAAAAGGASLEEVAAEARGALAMKTSQIADSDPAMLERGDAAADAAPDALRADASAELEVRNAIGLHARPAARF